MKIEKVVLLMCDWEALQVLQILLLQHFRGVQLYECSSKDKFTNLCSTMIPDVIFIDRYFYHNKKLYADDMADTCLETQLMVFIDAEANTSLPSLMLRTKNHPVINCNSESVLNVIKALNNGDLPWVK